MRYGKSPNIIIVTLFLGYLAFSLFTLPACTGKSDGSTYDNQLSQKRNVAHLLIDKYDAEMFECGTQEILKKTVVLDSIILGIKKTGGNYIIKAKVNTECNKKYYAELKCSKEIADQFQQTNSNAAYLAAQIHRVDSYSMIAEADSIDGTTSNLHLGNTLLLSGECLALAEIPTITNAD